MKFYYYIIIAIVIAIPSFLYFNNPYFFYGERVFWYINNGKLEYTPTSLGQILLDHNSIASNIFVNEYSPRTSDPSSAIDFYQMQNKIFDIKYPIESHSFERYDVDTITFENDKQVYKSINLFYRIESRGEYYKTMLMFIKDTHDEIKLISIYNTPI